MFIKIDIESPTTVIIRQAQFLEESAHPNYPWRDAPDWVSVEVDALNVSMLRLRMYELRQSLKRVLPLTSNPTSG